MTIKNFTFQEKSDRDLILTLAYAHIYARHRLRFRAVLKTISTPDGLDKLAALLKADGLLGGYVRDLIKRRDNPAWAADHQTQFARAKAKLEALSDKSLNKVIVLERMSSTFAFQELLNNLLVDRTEQKAKR